MASARALRSIQGEKQDDRQVTLWADDGDVAEFVEKATPGILGCREKGHDFPPIAYVGSQVFTEVDDEGLAVRRETCPRCECAVRVQRWGFAKRSGRTRFELIASSVTYKDGPQGERYPLKPGHGRMKRRQVTRAQVESLFGNMSPGQIKQHILAQGAERAQA